MVKKILSVAIISVFALSGCSQKEVEVKAPVAVKKAVTEVNTTTTEAKATVEEKVVPAAPKVSGGAMHVPFSEIMK